MDQSKNSEAEVEVEAKRSVPTMSGRLRQTSNLPALFPSSPIIVMSSNFVASNQTRSLRACMVCSVVQTQQRFIRDGCPNCEAFLDLTNHPDSVQECTSQVYEGLITLADPGQSWVAKWQRLDGYVAGVYAVKVVGMVSGLLYVAPAVLLGSTWVGQSRTMKVQKGP